MSFNKKTNPQRGGKVRNIRAFVKAYLNSESGRKDLARRPVRIGKGRDAVLQWRNPEIAFAFSKAVA